MRFLSFEYQKKVSWGVITGDGIVDLGCRHQTTLLDILRLGKLDQMKDEAARLTADIDVGAIKFLPPVLAPEKIICIGVNYANRNEEYKDGSKPPEYPSVFMRAPDSLTSHQQLLYRPPESKQLDYEGEIVIVIGRAGRRISEQDAYDYIAGLSIMNEGTLRDWVRHAKFNVTQGKNFLHSGAWGPWLVTADQFSAADYENMSLTTKVNREIRQHDTTANMMFPIKYIIHYLSNFYYLKPGDIIATGTPNGAGARFEPPKYLVPGDLIEISVAGIGTLSNGVIDEEI